MLIAPDNAALRPWSKILLIPAFVFPRASSLSTILVISSSAIAEEVNDAMNDRINAESFQSSWLRYLFISEYDVAEVKDFKVTASN